MFLSRVTDTPKIVCHTWMIHYLTWNAEKKYENFRSVLSSSAFNDPRIQTEKALIVVGLVYFLGTFDKEALCVFVPASPLSLFSN